MFPKPTKRVKTKKRIKRKSSSPLKIAKEKAWEAFSIYYRMSNADINGMLKCFTCGKIHPWKEMHPGHWVEGHNNVTYINPDYIRPQCVSCNIFKKGMQGEFRDRIRKELGDYTTDELLFESRKTKEISLTDYQELERFYKDKVNNL